MKLNKHAAIYGYGFILVMLLSSCISTKFKMDSSLSEKPKPALLTALSIGTEQEQKEEINLLELAVNILQNLELDDFGMETEKAIVSFLKTKNFDVFIDEDMAKAHDLPINTGESMTALGYWVHPKTSAYTTNYFKGLAIGFNKKNHMAKVKGDSNVEYFVYSDLRIGKAQIFLIFGGYPIITFRIVIVDSKGTNVLESVSFGKGKKSLFGPNMSKENLLVAIENAIISLNEL